MTRSQALFRSQLDGAGIFMLWLVKQELLGPWYSLPVKKIWPFVHGGHHPLPAPRIWFIISVHLHPCGLHGLLTFTSMSCSDGRAVRVIRRFLMCHSTKNSGHVGLCVLSRCLMPSLKRFVSIRNILGICILIGALSNFSYRRLHSDHIHLATHAITDPSLTDRFPIFPDVC